ncbi:PREDICTED: stomatal closure-related actin-binding protein 3-like [Tarenaya hassleriana]|uniref:stomatal closure-related actin-binding protein 3-like n=1 Tax=Tarenaya hassleriana TaxID=28532 RepID=UPI00053C5A3B|nr:PREDICTED: stomatal closure-related actin-binding protein 3-like [Tarenaya hassleriana]XP_010525426.1 PREDICTED: stomatal closure-related actin-binding protein 3-like [Tarenaya hassleriana]XP_010525427.1 PREDICTED: stomatal closure-related actin-binding protein 3-like [Tarenaya hassleriana]
MTKVCPEMTLSEAVLPVSADVSFASNHFPKYKFGPDNQIVEEPKEDEKGPSVKEIVEKETEQLSEQHKRLSVRDLASKFDKNLTAAANLTDEAKLREVASLEGHVMLKKLRDALESLRGCMAGQNKEDVEKAISMVEALAVKLTQNEGELLQEKFQVKKLANFLKQASEDAKKLVNQEKSFACAEIESARAVVHRLGDAFTEQERSSEASKTQGPDVEKLVEEVQEARRIKRMHQPTKVMDMQHELRALRNQIREKSVNSVKLQKEIAIVKRTDESKSHLYALDGKQSLGSFLRIRSCSDNAPNISECSVQWYRAASETSRREAISGANRTVYAPEPFDVGRVLQADVCFNGQKVTLTTDSPIDPAAGLQSHVESLMRKSHSEFNVVISQMNGQDHASRSNHVLSIGKMRIKLCRGWITKSREIYSTFMQLCGVRGKANAPAKALFWQPRKGLTFVLTFESEKDRNAAIVLARKYAFDCNVTLVGPDD